MMMRKKVLNIKQNGYVTTSDASAVQKHSLADVLQKKKTLQYKCFPIKFTKSLRPPFFTEHLYSDDCFWQ